MAEPLGSQNSVCYWEVSSTQRLFPTWLILLQGPALSCQGIVQSIPNCFQLSQDYLVQKLKANITNILCRIVCSKYYNKNGQQSDFFNICNKTNYVCKEQCVLVPNGYEIRGAFSTVSNSKMKFFVKIFNNFNPVTVFEKSSQSQMLDRVLNTTLKMFH